MLWSHLETEFRKLENEKTHLQRKEFYDQNPHKDYAELWERCAMAVKAKLESRTTFESAMRNGPIILIEATKEHSLCFEESRHEIDTTSDAI